MKKQPKSLSLIYENAQLKALEAVLTQPTDYFERKVRRWFSKTFSTPYQDTHKIPWPQLLEHYYEDNFESYEYNELFDMAVKEYLPEFVDQAEADDQAFADSLLDEQKATMKAKKEKEAKTQALDEATSKLASSASNVVEKAQSLKKQLDAKKNTQPIKQMSKKFDFGDPDDEM